MTTPLYTVATLLAALTLVRAETDPHAFRVQDYFAPSVHLSVAAGGSTENAEALAVGAHDPNRDGVTLQGLEIEAPLRLNDHLQGYAAWNLSWGGENEEWVDEFEEAYGKAANLPGGVELRGGRMLNRFGIRNAQHLHAWNTVDLPLVNGLFLGDEGLATEGADLTWHVPGEHPVALTSSYGEARAHDHADGDEADEATFEDEFFSANLTTEVGAFDVGGSLAVGDNGLGGETQIYALHAQYRHEAFTWNTEVMLRDIDAGRGHAHEHEEEEAEEDHHEDEAFPGDEELGIYTELLYRAQPNLELGLRGDYVGGIHALSLDERFRVSPLATLHLNEERNLRMRAQYNFDNMERSADAHSVWVQLQYSFGGEGDHSSHHHHGHSHECSH